MRVKIGLGILCLAGGALALSAQSAQSTQSPPGSSQMSTTPRPGGTTSSVDTSMSTRSGTNGTASSTQAPAMASDCTNDGWRGYNTPKFKSEKACQSYVKKHTKKGSTGETNAPKGDMSSGTASNTGTSGTSTGSQPRPTPHP